MFSFKSNEKSINNCRVNHMIQCWMWTKFLILPARNVILPLVITDQFVLSSLTSWGERLNDFSKSECFILFGISLTEATMVKRVLFIWFDLYYIDKTTEQLFWVFKQNITKKSQKQFLFHPFEWTCTRKIQLTDSLT